MTNKPSAWPPRPHRSAQEDGPSAGEEERFAWTVTLNSVAIVVPTNEQISVLKDGLDPYGAAVSCGHGRISVTMSAHGANVADALSRGLRIWGEALLDAGVAAGIAVAAEVRTVDKRDHTVTAQT